MNAPNAWWFFGHFLPLLKADLEGFEGAIIKLDKGKSDDSDKPLEELGPIPAERFEEEVAKIREQRHWLFVLGVWGERSGERENLLWIKGSRVVYKGKRIPLTQRRIAQEALAYFEADLDGRLPDEHQYSVEDDLYGLPKSGSFEGKRRDEVLNLLRHLRDKPLTYLCIKRDEDEKTIFKIQIDLESNVQIDLDAAVEEPDVPIDDDSEIIAEIELF